MRETLQRIQEKVVKQSLRLNPPLQEAQVIAFEQQQRIALPDSYRAFLTEVGDGGDGPPCYGLQCLGDTKDVWYALEQGYQDYLAVPFPFTEAWVWEEEPDTPEREARMDTVKYGNLNLGTDGCGLYWTLIVTGEARGQIWLADVGIQPCAPNRDFLSWYEYWLDGIAYWD